MNTYNLNKVNKNIHFRQMKGKEFCSCQHLPPLLSHPVRQDVTFTYSFCQMLTHMLQTLAHCVIT